MVNLWEYDAAEVWYADGRLQLQGANESGKSTLMTLTTLLLIAGDISSHNIDTLGQSQKRFRYYVEPTGHALDRRDATQAKNRGWAWLEFGSVGGGIAEYFTLLLFAESRRADGALKVQWCTAHGSARARDGLVLAKAGIVAEPGQFRDVPGFTMHRSGTACREDIARTLYGSSTTWLDQVIRIGRKAKAEATLEQVEERREQAEADRKRCVDRWLGCVDSGLPRLRAVEDPSARHVTAALESVRAARAAISIRDWPDDPRPPPTASRAWTRMTEAVAMLRSRLESLADRTIRTITPGDGDEDFPGAVEVVVAPPDQRWPRRPR